jgi:hypothetical protein
MRRNATSKLERLTMAMYSGTLMDVAFAAASWMELWACEVVMRWRSAEVELRPFVGFGAAAGFSHGVYCWGGGFGFELLAMLQVCDK